MTSASIHVAQVPESGWPCPLPPPLGCNLSTNRKRKPKWRRCVAASIAVGPSAILTGSRTRPSDWGSNARFGPVEDRRNNRRLATFTCTFSRFGGCHLSPFSRWNQGWVAPFLAAAVTGVRLWIGVDSTRDSIGGLSPTILVPVQKPVESEQMLGFSGGHPFVAGKPKNRP